MDRSPGAPDQVPEEDLGEPLPGLAVTGRGSGHPGQTAIETILLEPIDGLITGVIIGEDLGEEEGQCDRRGVDPLAPEMMALSAGRLDQILREELEEGESLSLLEPIAKGTNLVG
jgi:hypothetical protein